MNSHEQTLLPTVLVVDDEPAICMLVSEILNESECRVLSASDGFEALRILERESEDVAVAILDYSMPGMDCETLISRLHQINRQIKLIISSGQPGSLFETPAALGISAFMPKPYSMRELASVVLRLIHQDAEPSETTE